MMKAAGQQRTEASIYREGRVRVERLGSSLGGWGGVNLVTMADGTAVLSMVAEK